jgi:curved DNA-binding protein CbpA
MSILTVFERARETLGLPVGAEPAAIKRAYRLAVLAHPPDQDPDGFRKVRDAYEVLTDQGDRARALLLRAAPAIDPPPLPHVDPTPRGATAVALLRAVVMSVDASALAAALASISRAEPLGQREGDPT